MPFHNSKHIALVVWNFNFGGQEKRYFKLAYLLHTSGVSVSLYANKVLEKKSDDEINKLLNNQSFKNRIHYISVNYYLRRLLIKYFNHDLFIHKLNKRINIDYPDIVISNMRLNFLAQIKKINNTRVIKDFVSPNNVDLFFSNDKLENLFSVDHLFFISETVYTKFSENYQKIKGNTELPPFTIFSQPFSFFNGDEVSTSGKENLIVFAHRLIERKNPVLFAKIVNELCQNEKYKNWNFAIFGQGPLEKKVKSILASNIRSGRVQVEFVSNLKSFLDKSKIFVSLIEPDNYPSQSVIEAMHSGNALLVLNSGTSKRFIEGNGFLVEKNYDVIRNKLEALMESDNLNDYQVKSTKLAHDCFSSKSYIDFFMAEITKVIPS